MLDFRSKVLQILKQLLQGFQLYEDSREIADVCCEIEGKEVTLANIQYNWLCGYPNFDNIYYKVKLQMGFAEWAPMLVVSLIGLGAIQVYGVVWNHSNYCIDPLSSGCSLLFVPDDPAASIRKVAKLLAAIHHAIGGLKEYYLPSNHGKFKKGPYFIEDWNMMKMKKEYWVDDKCLYEGEYKDKGKVVVKFVYGHYGKDVHSYLADKGVAPKLYSCDELPGRWYAVVMQKVEDGKVMNMCTMEDIHEEMKQTLKETVVDMHLKGYVHGDLRPQNVLIMPDNSIRILDFDWAGKVGEVKYPDDINMDCRWHNDVHPGGPIKEEHDLHIMKQISEIEREKEVKVLN